MAVKSNTCFLIDSLLEEKNNGEREPRGEPMPFENGSSTCDPGSSIARSHPALRNDRRTGEGGSRLHSLISNIIESSREQSTNRPVLASPFDFFSKFHIMNHALSSLRQQPITLASTSDGGIFPHYQAPSCRTVRGNPKKYRCDVCDKTFSRSNTLVTHKRIHTGQKPFICDNCGRAFRQPGNLTRHRLTHTTVKPYVCVQCGKAFNRASNLHTHMRTHTDK